MKFAKQNIMINYRLMEQTLNLLVITVTTLVVEEKNDRLVINLIQWCPT